MRCDGEVEEDRGGRGGGGCEGPRGHSGVDEDGSEDEERWDLGRGRWGERKRRIWSVVQVEEKRKERRGGKHIGTSPQRHTWRKRVGTKGGARRGQVYQRDHTVGGGGEKTNGGIYPEGRGRRGRGEGEEGREARQQH